MFTVYSPGSYWPRLLPLSNNRFVTVRTDISLGYRIAGSIFNSQQQAIGASFIISSGMSYNPSITHFQGGFVVVWHEVRRIYYDIKLRLYDTNANAVSSATLVSNSDSYVQAWLIVKSLPSGGFVISWRSVGQPINSI